ncbi:MAG: dihydrodipicolinate synthase family protein [Ruminococcaceae bacterium]|nr:dihydrodipicolinate synthase family protein [Oscillospiraceae bacterium]
MKIEGIMPALVSPLNSDETVNLSVLQNLIEYFLQKGANGFYLAGATGEGLAINPDQRRLLAERAVETVKDRVPCIVQVASTDFGEVLRLAKHAESIGAHAISSTPPIFFRYDEDDVYQYYKRLSDAVHIPIMIYNSPLAGFPITPAFAARMFEIDNVTSIKWTSSDYFGLMQLKELTQGEMTVMNGPDEMLLMGLSAGADGGIGTTYNFMLTHYLSVYGAFRDGNMEKAKNAQDKITAIIAALRTLKGCPSIPATKALLEEVGFAVGDAAFPMKKLSSEKKRELVNVLTEAGWNREL